MEVKIGNIFESSCTAIVNTVNCVGVMGKGVALEFKKRYPDMFMEYVLKCDRGEVKPGIPYVYNKDGACIVNFPTKDHWRSPSRLSYVVDGLDWFVNNYEKYGISSIAFPPLGCGNGGLSWREVGPLMYNKLSQLPIHIEVYAPYGTSSVELKKEFLMNPILENDLIGNCASRFNYKWYLILQVIKELNERQYALKVGRTIYQKICYVLTRNGVDTGFVFSKSSYGPFSTQAKDSILAFANANLITEKKLGKMIMISVPDDVNIKKDRFTEAELIAVEKTVDLFGRIKSTNQAEMIATVLYAYDQLKHNNNTISDEDIYNYVLDWKPYWKEDRDFELCDTIQNMAMLSLMNISCSGRLIDTMLV